MTLLGGGGVVWFGSHYSASVYILSTEISTYSLYRFQCWISFKIGADIPVD